MGYSLEDGDYCPDNGFAKYLKEKRKGKVCKDNRDRLEKILEKHLELNETTEEATQ